jgi:hypothetical protein
MKDEEKAKDQLIKEMQKMREKVAGLEEVKLECKQVEEKLKQSYKRLQKIIEGTAHIITKVVEREPKLLLWFMILERLIYPLRL